MKTEGLCGFTASQLRKLNRPVGDRRLHIREVEGRKLFYIEGWYAISLANEIFGFAGWDRATTHVERVHERTSADHVTCGYMARVRVTVRAAETAVIREGTGWGWASSRTAGIAYERALKAAETDATKRALLTFGPQFGLTLYDRDQQPGPDKISLFASDGSLLADDLSPEAFSSGLRQLIERSASIEELDNLVKHNTGSISNIRVLNPALRNVEGTHFSDLLLRLVSFGRRRLENAVPTDIQAVQPEIDSSRIQQPIETDEASRVGGGQRIDKSQLQVGIEKRFRSKAHLRRVAQLPCLVCSRQPSHAHHLRFAQRRGLAQKVSDEYVVPLCALHHGDLHRASREEHWWQAQAIDPIPVAAELWGRRESG